MVDASKRHMERQRMERQLLECTPVGRELQDSPELQLGFDCAPCRWTARAAASRVVARPRMLLHILLLLDVLLLLVVLPMHVLLLLLLLLLG